MNRIFVIMFYLFLVYSYADVYICNNIKSTVPLNWNNVSIWTNYMNRLEPNKIPGHNDVAITSNCNVEIDNETSINVNGIIIRSDSTLIIKGNTKTQYLNNDGGNVIINKRANVYVTNGFSNYKNFTNSGNIFIRLLIIRKHIDTYYNDGTIYSLSGSVFNITNVDNTNIGNFHIYNSTFYSKNAVHVKDGHDVSINGNSYINAKFYVFNGTFMINQIF